MHQIKIFKEVNVDTLQQKVNLFLCEKEKEIDVVEIKFIHSSGFGYNFIIIIFKKK